MLRTVTNVWTVSFMRRTSILVNERLFPTYMTDTLVSVNSYYDRQVLDDDRNELQKSTDSDV